MLLFILFCLQTKAVVPGPPTGLMTELLSFPEKTVISDETPEFSWVMTDDDQNEYQTAYQVLVSSSFEGIENNTGDMWNSGKVNSQKSASVSYSGSQLINDSTYYWKVCVWDKDGNQSPYSLPQQFRYKPKSNVFTSNKWGLKDQELFLDRSSFMVNGAGDDWQNYTLECKMIIETDAVGILFRVEDNNNFYMWQFNAAQKKFRPHKNINGNFLVIKEVDYDFNLNEYYNIEIQLKDSIIKTFIDNVLIDSVIDKSLSRGKIGFRQGRNETGRIDSLVVKQEDTILLRENFDNPFQFPGFYAVEAELISPQTVELTTNETYFVDFGKAAFGRLRLTLDASGGESITVQFGENKEGGHVDATPPNSNVVYYETSLDLTAGLNTYIIDMPEPNSLQSQGISNVLFNTIPFRYCEISGFSGVLTKDDIFQEAVFYPFNDTAATFSCSNDILNSVWELCHYSMKACSWLGIYVDGNRERKPYEADAYIQQLGHYCSDKEGYSVARRSHEYLIKNPTWPTEWTPHSVLMAYSDWMWTGDTGSLATYYNDLKAKTQYALVEENDLISTRTGKVTDSFLNSIHLPAGTNYSDIVDWPVSERDGFLFRNYNTVVNAVHYGAASRFKEIAQALSKTEDYLFFNDLVNDNYTAFNQNFWDGTNKNYVDGINTKHAALHSTVFALAFGLADSAKKQEVKEYLVSKGMDCSVYSAQYYLEALFECGLAQKAINLMASQEKRSWYNMMQEGSTVSMESWGQFAKSNQDWNHAWGAAPANIIPRFLMGIRPLLPGFEKFQIKPQTGNLDFARLEIPTIKGDINVGIEKNDSLYTIDFTVPVNSLAKVYIPAFNVSNNNVKLNDNSVEGKREGNFIVLDSIGSGTYTLIRKINPALQDFKYASAEHELVSPAEEVDVAYGVDGDYFYIFNQKDDMVCNHTYFGDTVLPGGNCYIKPSDIIINFITPTEGDIFTWPALVDVEVQATAIEGVKNVTLYLNDELVSNKLTPPFTWNPGADNWPDDLDAGTYTLKAVVEDNNGQERSDTISFTVRRTSLIESESMEGLEIFPNPVSSRLTVSYNHGDLKKLEIFNLFGQVVYVKKINDSMVEIPIKGKFASGTYYVKVTNNENDTALKKLIIE